MKVIEISHGMLLSYLYVDVLSRKRSHLSSILIKELNSMDSGIMTCNDSHTIIEHQKQKFVFDYGDPVIDYGSYLRYISSVNQSYPHHHALAIVIRTYRRHQFTLVRLIRGLLQQSNYTDGIHFIIVCTEFSSIAFIQKVVRKSYGLFRRTKHPDLFTLEVLNISRSLYDDSSLNPFIARIKTLCDPLHQRLLINKWGLKGKEIKVTCRANNPLHYFLTDLAIQYTLTNYPSCKYLIVTNGDNYYYGAYLKTALPHLISGKFEITLNDWNHRGVIKTVHPSLGNVDLGCSIFSVEFLKRTNMTSLINALPPCPDARDFHTADGHFIDTLVSTKHMRYMLLHNYLFDHN